MKTTMGVKLDIKTRERLKALGEQKERTPHWLMTRAIEEYLDREESFQREKHEDLQRWQKYQDTDEYISRDEMKDRLSDLVARGGKQSKAG